MKWRIGFVTTEMDSTGKPSGSGFVLFDQNRKHRKPCLKFGYLTVAQADSGRRALQLALDGVMEITRIPE